VKRKDQFDILIDVIYLTSFFFSFFQFPIIYANTLITTLNQYILNPYPNPNIKNQF